jgi:hypothetical protein
MSCFVAGVVAAPHVAPPERLEEPWTPDHPQPVNHHRIQRSRSPEDQHRILHPDCLRLHVAAVLLGFVFPVSNLLQWHY